MKQYLAILIRGVLRLRVGNRWIPYTINVHTNGWDVHNAEGQEREMYSLGSDVDNHLSLNSRVIASAYFHVTIPHEISTCPWTC